MKALEETSEMHKRFQRPRKSSLDLSVANGSAGFFLLWPVAVAWFVIHSIQGPAPIAITTDKAAVRDITQTVSATGKIRPEV